MVGGLGMALFRVVTSLLLHFLEVIFLLLKSGNILLDGSYDIFAHILSSINSVQLGNWHGLTRQMV